MRPTRALVVVMLPALVMAACSSSDGGDDDSPSIGGINGPAVVDPSFDPFATGPSSPPATDGG